VYQLPGQETWEGSAVIHPTVLGIGFGVTAMAGSLAPGVQARIDLLILGVLTVDALLVWARARRISRGLGKGLPSSPQAMEHRTPLLVLRMAVGVLAPAMALVLGARPLALVALALNLLLDRFLFYGLAIHRSTEAEISRVDRVLAGLAEGRETDTSGGNLGREGET
jgi:hypothetical protein